MYQTTSTNEEKVPVTFNPKTANGIPAGVENLTVTSTSGDATVEIDAENKTIYFISGTGGLSTFTVTADADLGEGVTTISEDVEYFVVVAQATSFGLTAGAPILK